MPGQRKRKRRHQDQARRAAARFAPEAGSWDVLFETQDESAWRAEVRRLRTEHSRLDWTAVRIDTLCGRSTHPTTYRLSVFVPVPGPSPADGGAQPTPSRPFDALDDLRDRPQGR